ncbi:MAG: hypothetical protein ISN29_02615 [Gammaproteobacteria bacterium AqS3]|nr:hypothetical protein [Gammaproteobacteria bacterium AqS3]
MRDMLRNDGLAKTTEFLASKFSGDELQQVFGRKEFVQFVQGTTGRRGILAKLEKLITQNAETGPIERFGEDLENTLGNKFERFIQAFVQIGSEYGQPLAFAAKKFLDVANIFLAAVIGLNQITGGLLAWIISAAGAFTVVSALLGKDMRMVISGLFMRIFGKSSDTFHKYRDIGAAAHAAAGAAPPGMGWTAAQTAAEAAAFDAAQKAGKRASASPSDYIKSQNAREKARQSADRARASTATATATATAKATEAAAEASAAKAEAKVRPQQGFDTGAKAWNDARRAKQESILRAFAREDDFERRTREAQERQTRAARREKWREEHGYQFDRRFKRNFDPNYAINRLQDWRMRRNVLHRVYEDQVVKMSGIVDDLIGTGKLDPKYRRGVLHSLMTMRQSLNDWQVVPMDPYFYKGGEDLFKRTGYRPITPDDELIPSYKRKKTHEGGIDRFLYKKWTGHGATMSDVSPGMWKKSQMPWFHLLEAMPYMDPDQYYQKYRSPVSGYADAIMGVAAMSGAGMGAGPSSKSAPNLLEWKRFRPTPGLKIPAGYGMGGPPTRNWNPGIWDMLSTIPFLLGQGWEALRSGGTYKKAFGGGGFGTGFAAAMSGTGLFDMLGSVREYNAGAEAKGRKGMRENMAKVAWFMGKFWRIATNPLMLATGIAAAVWAGSLALFNRTDRGRDHLAILEYRKESFFNMEKILEFQVSQGQALLEAIQADLDARGMGNPSNKRYSSFLEMFQDGWNFLKDGVSNIWQRAIKESIVQRQLGIYSTGKMTPEQQLRMFGWFDQAGVAGWEAIPRAAPGPNGERFMFRIKWRDDHDKKLSLAVGEMDADQFINEGRQNSSITGGGLLNWALTEGNDYFDRLAKEGPKGARDFAYAARGMAHRAAIGTDGRAISYIPIKSVVNVYAQDGQDLVELVDETVAKNMIYFAKRIQRESSVEVNTQGPLPDDFPYVP